jgi:hypothetical protein
MFYCSYFKRTFPLSDALYVDRSEQSVYIGCPVCLAHGMRNAHCMWGSLEPAPNEIVSTCGKPEPATARTVPVGIEV